MNLNGQIIVIDDDVEDLDIIKEVLEDVIAENSFANEIITFDNGEDTLKYLREMPFAPFLIISDINMPRMNGFQIRQTVFDDPPLRQKCAPYIFLTTSGDNTAFMRQSYEMSIQGYFTKPNDYTAYHQLLTDILRYWKVAKLANRI
ncbi:response regulator [Flavobacterium sp. DGU11]|uniref:Response regulator n=1 Tax=Flavobacterium arundinis TaxID=3139143 RepID=A0ABU9HUJ7_9FLAO